MEWVNRRGSEIKKWHGREKRERERSDKRMSRTGKRGGLRKSMDKKEKIGEKSVKSGWVWVRQRKGKDDEMRKDKKKTKKTNKQEK